VANLDKVTAHTLQEIFLARLNGGMPSGAAETVRSNAEPYLASPGVLDGRQRLLQLVPLADRAWTHWASRAIRTLGLTDLADVLSRQHILDDETAALASALAPDYCRQLQDCPPSPAPGWSQLRDNALVAVERAGTAASFLAQEPPGLGEIEPDAFADAVRDAAAALLALWRMGVVNLPHETRLVMSDARGGIVKLAY
jgi:hypothetical protein